MHMRSLKRIRDEQSGVTLIEVLVSALVLIIVSGGFVLALTAGSKATAQERHRVKANNLAEQELERVRSLRIADLTNWTSTRRVLEDGTELAANATCPASGQTCYTITSSTQFLTETASLSTCSQGTGSRDFLQLQVSVSWTGMGTLHPVTAGTIISPPSGSLVPNSGSLLVQINDSNDNGISGVTLTGSGAGSFTGTTGSSGCVQWRNLPAGDYALTVSGAASGMVNPDGDPPPGNSPTPAQTVSVVDQGTNTVNLQFDRPGSIRSVTFRTNGYTGLSMASSANSLVVDQSGLSQAKVYAAVTTPAGQRQGSFTTSTNLFPFTSPYSLYGGWCNGNLPPSGAALGSATVTPGGTTTFSGSIQLPALWLLVRNSSGGAIAGANVTVTSDNCTEVVGGVTKPVKRFFTTNNLGQLIDVGQAATSTGNPGLPYGQYDVCGDALVSGTRRREVDSNLPVTSLIAGWADTIDLTSTDTSGACP